MILFHPHSLRPILRAIRANLSLDLQLSWRWVRRLLQVPEHSTLCILSLWGRFTPINLPVSDPFPHTVSEQLVVADDGSSRD
jgi:hypothetical protein